jgi:hypothetical protein
VGASIGITRWWERAAVGRGTVGGCAVGGGICGRWGLRWVVASELPAQRVLGLAPKGRQRCSRDGDLGTGDIREERGGGVGAGGWLEGRGKASASAPSMSTARSARRTCDAVRRSGHGAIAPRRTRGGGRRGVNASECGLLQTQTRNAQRAIGT